MSDIPNHEDNNNNVDGDEKEFIKNCLMCNTIDCFRLNEFQEDNPDVGKELHLGELLFKKIHHENNEELASIICKNNSFFEILCFFVNIISDIEENNILRDNLFLSARDLKTSIFLAMTANYRNAMQVLRCSYESLLFCLYYMLDLNQAKDDEEKDVVRNKYQNWVKGGVNKRIDVFTELFRRLGLISRKEEKEWRSLYGILSKYIHSPRSSWGEKIQKPDLDLDLSCMANNIFDLSSLKSWSENFRKVLYILVKIGIYFHPLNEIKNHEIGNRVIERFNFEIDSYFEKYPETKNENNILVKLQNLME